MEPTKAPDPPAYLKLLEETRRFLDVPLKVSIQLGNKPMSIREILLLKKGAIIQLQKSAGENHALTRFSKWTSLSTLETPCTICRC